MNRRLALLFLLAALWPWQTRAHIGSPDVFYEGHAGPYPVAVTVRVPNVVPGRAQIITRVLSQENVDVAFAPIESRTAVSNTPPAETAKPVLGETNVFTGELWLMTTGAYSIDVRVHGKSGDGSARVPVDSIARRQLPLPAWLGGVLLALGAILFTGGVGIVAAAAGEAVLPPEVSSAPNTRRRYWTAVSVTTIVLTVLLAGGWKWWGAEEENFRARLLQGGWPDMTARVETHGAQRILYLTLGESDWSAWNHPDKALAPDHGKLLHLFLVRQPAGDSFAHIHPSRAPGGDKYEVALPALPPGEYELFCDLTLAKSGFSSTATNTVHIPTASTAPTAGESIKTDPDDSCTAEAIVAARDKAGSDTICRLPNGLQVVWKAHDALHARRDAGLRFEVRDETGQPAALEPYMGMISHAAVLRSDGQVFAHLHPAGNFSMAAQIFFDDKMARELGAEAICGPGGNSADSVKSKHLPRRTPIEGNESAITLPYEFPAAGDYRLWVQFKSTGKVMTAIFDTTVM